MLDKPISIAELAKMLQAGTIRIADIPGGNFEGSIAPMSLMKLGEVCSKTLGTYNKENALPNSLEELNDIYTESVKEYNEGVLTNNTNPYRNARTRNVGRRKHVFARLYQAPRIPSLKDRSLIQLQNLVLQQQQEIQKMNEGTERVIEVVTEAVKLARLSLAILITAVIYTVKNVKKQAGR